MPEKKFIGQRIKRREDPRLITGTSHYVDDLKLPGLLHMALLRSVHAHARIRSIRSDEAAGQPGVVAILTGNEVQKRCGTVPCASSLPGLKVPAYHLLAVDKVLFVGQPVAAVIAEDRYLARDAVDLIEVDYAPLVPVVNPEKALEKGSPRVHDQFGDNLAYRHNQRGGDDEKAFAQAHKVVRQRMINQRLAPVALEPRGVVAEYLPGEGLLTVWSSTQIPHLLRTQLANMVRLPEHRVRIIAPEVGGGFGSKLNVYAEEGLVAYAAMKTGRPVKWTETRRENLQATIHGRDQINEVEAAVQKDGRIAGLRVRIIADLGAYHQLLTPAIPTLTALMLSGPYKIPNISCEVLGVFTNKMATDAYRGAGRPEATYLLERIVDRIAQELALDPAQVRQKNFAKAKEFPFATATGLTYDSGDYAKTLKLALEKSNYAKLREEQKKLRKQGKYLGIGLSTYVEICAMGPSAAMPAGGWESATVRVEPTGKVTVLTGASPHGQGQETSFAQMAAERLGVSLDDIRVVHGDTSIVQYGIGTFGSRGTAVGGTAVLMALDGVREKALQIAAHLLKTSLKNLVWKNGKISVKGSKKSVTFQDVALEAYTAKNLPKKISPGLEATRFYEPSNFTFPFGAHVAVVAIDGETGEIDLKSYLAVDDCGNVVNPMLVDGQVHGGIAQGLGQALMEEVVYDESGQLLTATLMDYAVPKIVDLPRYETARTVTPSPVNPMGMKGVGEAGTIGSTPALVNAVVDALSPLGVQHVDMPLKAEKIWKLLAEKPR